MMSNVFPLDLATGEEIWRKDYNVNSNGPNGVAIAYGMVFAATGDTATAFALDVKTGEELWSATLTNNNYECIDMVPGVYDNTVYISTNPNNTTYGNYRGGARGILYALDAKSGSTLWSFDTAADNLWGAPRLNSGAGLWYPPSFDEAGSMYIGTGNAGPYPGNEEFPNGSSRPGANDHASSMVSIDLDTGGPNWFLNAYPHDIMDHDFQNSPVLATVTLNETDALIAVGSGKTGTVIAANAKTGAMLWRTDVGKHQNDLMQELPPGTTEIYPGTLGGVLTPLAYSDGRIFATYIDLPAYLSPTGEGDRPDEQVPGTGGVCAIDATNGSIIWDNKIPAFVLTGATVANDLVFVSGFEGILRAYDVSTGDEV
jgi:alcohol dehydrogenase (cytochrome c)